MAILGEIKSYAKVNLFLKITGKSGGYHSLISRFMLFKNDDFCDFLEIKEGENGFKILGDFNCEMPQNTIFKAYSLLLPFVEKTNKNSEIKRFKNLQISVQKKIPKGGGLGGGSSNAAVFLKFCDECFQLNLGQNLLKIAAQIGSDVAFFTSGVALANCRGRGEIIESLNENPLEIEILDSKIHCNSGAVFKEYSKNFYAPINAECAELWANKTNLEILNQSAENANDLLKAAIALYPSLKDFLKENNGAFLSGSGGCFWRAKQKAKI